MSRPRRWWKPALAGAVLLLGTAAAAWLGLRLRQPPTPPPPLAQTLVPDPVALAPGVYLLGATEPAAAYAVDTSDGLVLIDSGLENSAAVVTSQLARLHLDVRRLRAILLTHVHGDHSLGAEHLRTMTGARVYAGRGDCAPLREGGPREALCSTAYLPEAVLHPTTVDVELAGDETLTFGDARFQVIAAPGHTPGSVCYLLERPGLRALFAGDVVQHLSTASPGALGTYSTYLPPLYRGNARDYLASLRRLRDLPVPDLVLPGHPRMDGVPESPRLSPERWHALLDGGIGEMERLLARYEADGANFLDGHPKELLPGLHYLGDYGGRAVYCLDTPTGPVLFDAPGGPLLTDFLAHRFEKLGWKGRKPVAVLLTAAGGEATAGLADVVRDGGCRVVVARAGLEAVRRLCPAGTEVLAAEDLGKGGRLGFEVRAVPLAGRDPAPAAYRLRWAGKVVLVSGRIPVKPSHESAEALLADVRGPGGSAEGYLASLDRLAEPAPDLWLPAVPVHGQNANLYDDEWSRLLRQNWQMVSINVMIK